MVEFWILILVALIATNSLDKAEAVKVKELKTFDEIFGEGWWDKGEAEDLKTPAPTNFGQNVHHQIDRQNTQIGQIEPNSTDQIGQIEPNSTDQLGQIEPNSTDQNPPFIESNHSKNGAKQNEMMEEENIAEDERKRNIIDKFHAMKDELKQKGKFPWKERNRIEKEIAKQLGVNYSKIYKWKKEFGLSRKMHNGKEKNDRKNLVEKFDQRKAELMRAGLKNAYSNQIDKAVAKELGLDFRTVYRWKKELGQTKPKHIHSDSEQMELMKQYYEIKDQTPKNSDREIAKMLKIGKSTLIRWKKQFKLQQLHPNSVDSVENAGSNVQEIGKSNSGSI
uniref:Transposase n=1 Tax=Globodera rostochiensis TaxID=31243 RepID=A0A914HQL3_GLORO